MVLALKRCGCRLFVVWRQRGDGTTCDSGGAKREENKKHEKMRERSGEEEEGKGGEGGVVSYDGGDDERNNIVELTAKEDVQGRKYWKKEKIKG